ncbi:hypothetical protein J2X69_004833 [Algoriphagus sp. 4150]|uniref:FG-GAP repeat domain-containing protein n=1 Tax=Algoriphagus sp. 4150 TaxID=2817756 RepID=UPI00285425B7|nr:VCBS repeat-containing protein [Algoriphagus sp. 4150]MDR7132462.1 hypothetical protein [Algoriphagus sp. 4150]
MSFLKILYLPEPKHDKMISIPLLLTTLAFQFAPNPTFVAQEIDNNVSIGYGLAIGDVDGDGKPDILLADKNEIVWYRNGDWKKFVMVENLTESDNVCIAARDVNGDGKVEVAIGAQWNPGETTDPEKSGAVFFLDRPEDPTEQWTAIPLHHEPTTHRMQWIKSGDAVHLIVLPLHGRGNQNGEGVGVKVIAYEYPADPLEKWNYEVIDDSMHMTHNLEIVKDEKGESILIGGKEGVKRLNYQAGNWQNKVLEIPGNPGIGELRMGDFSGKKILTTVEPMHGNSVVAYEGINLSENTGNIRRYVLNAELKEGHALAIDDFTASGIPQIAVGWRNANEEGDFGIKLFYPKNESFSDFDEVWIDKNGMACEDLQVADLDGDGKPDLIASGRSTGNLKIYWNKSQ